MRGQKLSVAQRGDVWALLTSGLSNRAVATELGWSSTTVDRLVRVRGGVRPRSQPRSPLRLSLAEREEISLGLATGLSVRAIARRLGRHPSTVSREVRANGGRDGYRAWAADGAAERRACRPKEAKLARCPRLRREVEARLAKRWSPQQIARGLREEFPDDIEMRVSHETIYQSLYVQGRGALRKELTAALRTGRALRRPHSAHERRGQLRDMVLISERPAEVEDRAVPGHWEGDLIIGKDSGSAIGTLVERSTRFVILLHLEDQTAETVRQALTARVQTLPHQLRRTLTWDRGKEMAQHVRFTVDTGVQVYFCDPYKPWQRGSNENTNGLLRQYFPKGTDLSIHTQEHLDDIARELNDRPRQTLGWKKPRERLAELLR